MRVDVDVLNRILSAEKLVDWFFHLSSEKKTCFIGVLKRKQL